MELKIYDKQGLVKMVVSPDGSSQWNHEIGVENVVTVNFTTWEYFVMEVGLYILVEGVQFRLKSEYKPKHVDNRKYTYNLKFYGREHDMQDILFCRLNQSDDDFESVFAYDCTPMELLQKVVDNMNRNSDGVVWKAGEAVPANRKTINFNGLYCWDALSEGARAFETEWWMDGEYLNLSKCLRGEYVSLGYGQGLRNGLTQNENSTSAKWFTRLIPVGSSRNIDRNKYGYSTLQLPGREKYIDINTQQGLKEYREESAFSEIYPHREGSISSVRSELKTNEETGDFTVWYVKDESLPFNPDEYMIPNEVIHMTFNTGSLAGKEFEVNWDADKLEFEIINQYPDDNTHIPGGNIVPKSGDKYVLTNISMPDEYIKAAEEQYKEAVDVYIEEYAKDISIYSGNTDYIYVTKNNVPLQIGQRVVLVSEQYFDSGSMETRITRLSRKLNILGDASFDCSNAVSSTWKSNVDSSLNHLQFSVAQEMAKTIIDILKVGDSKEPSNYNVFSALRSLNTFLRKDKDDRSKGKIASDKGFEAGEFIEGLTGSGAKIDNEGRAELHSLFVRQFIETPTMKYNRVEIRMGDEINSVSAGVIESVFPDTDAKGNTLTTGTLILKLEETDFGSLEKDDIVFQIYSDMENKQNNAVENSDDGKGNRQLKGFATVMFKVLEVSGDRNEIIRYSLRPLSENWKKQIHPYQFGTFAQRGNFSNGDRQTIVYQGICPESYTRYMFGVNDWEFSAKMIGMQLGYLGNLSVFGIDMSGYSAYLNNVYFTGQIRQLYIPQWIEGESVAYNGTIVYMGGEHYVAKGETNNPPLFNDDEYDLLAKEGKDGVGIKSITSFYLISNSPQKPVATSSAWSSSLLEPTELKPYLWKKTVVTYTNSVKDTTIECISVRGKDGTSVNIKGTFSSEEDLEAAYPNGGDTTSDAYIVNGNLYVWTGSEWKNVGAIKGDPGDTAYIHIKYANETTSGTQVNIGGTFVILSFTSGDGEETGDFMGVYTDYTPADSSDVSDYKWKKIRGDKGTDGSDSTSYWLDSPVGSICLSADGTPTPSSFIVSMKKKTGNGNVVACSDFYLAAWKYDGNWQLVSISSVKTSSITIIPANSTVYKQYRVTAHTTRDASESNIINQIGIGVSFDGMNGENGKDGEDGIDSTSYWLDSPVGSVNFATDGTPTPSSFIVSMKKKTGNGNVVACSDFYLAAWKYDNNWKLVSISSVKTSSIIIIPANSTAYKQYRVTAHTTSDASESNIINQIGIGVSFDGMKGENGADGIYVYDCGLFNSEREYYYQTVNGKVRRDKIVYEIDGAFYNFLVRSRQNDGSNGLVATPPTSTQGDVNWEVMSQFQSVIANTVFGTNANIGGFITSSEKMKSQSETTDGYSLFELDGQKGTMVMRQSNGTIWKLDEYGVQSVGNSEGERVVLDPNTRSISAFDAKGVERTVIDGSEYTLNELIDATGGSIPLMKSATNNTGYVVSVSDPGTESEKYDLSSMFYSSAGTLNVSISKMEVKVVYLPQVTRNVIASPELSLTPLGEVNIHLETYESTDSLNPISRKLIATVSADGNISGGTESSSNYKNRSPVLIGKGYHKIVATITAINGKSSGSTFVTGYWSITSAYISVESYVSRHFANGMFLSKSTSEYFLSMTENGRMVIQIGTGGNVYRYRNGSMTVNGVTQPITVYSARVEDNSKTQTVAPTKTELLKMDGGTVAITKLSSPTSYQMTFPPVYGLNKNNTLVNLVGYGFVAGSSEYVAKASISSIQTASDGSMYLKIIVSDDETANYGGFYIEVKKIM